MKPVLTRAVPEADAIVERRRGGVAREWRALRAAIRAETGAGAGSAAWVAGIAGLALGLELSRRWFGRDRRRRNV